MIGAEPQIDCRNNNNLPHQVLSGGYGTDINIPVYATVKGVLRNKSNYVQINVTNIMNTLQRASQIRSMPFTGNSSDSSDGECEDVRGNNKNSLTASSLGSTDLTMSSP